MVISVVGIVMWVASGILLFVFWLTAMEHWLGFVGFVLAILLAPGLVVFPIVFWIVEGKFPAVYFAMCAIGLVGLILAGAARRE